MTSAADLGLDFSSAQIFLLFLATLLTANVFYPWLKRLTKNLPPGPTGVPILGYLPFLGKEPYKTLQKLGDKYGKIYSLYLGNKYSVIVNDYELAKELLNHPAALDRDTDILHRLEPIGFGTLNGPEWVEQRRFAFYSARELGFGKGPWENIIVEEAISYAKQIKTFKGSPTDISKSVSESVSSNIIYFLTGRRLDKVADQKVIRLTQDYAKFVLNLFGPSRPISILPGLWHFLVAFKIAGYDKMKNIIKKFHLFIDEEVNRHKTIPELKDSPDIFNSYLRKLETVREPVHYYSERNMKGMINSFFLGGSDTIVSSLGWALRLLSVHQDIQSKVHAEIMEVLGKDGIARYEERHLLPYTFSFLMECQRYSTIAPLSNARKANQDFVFNGYDIPKGAQIIPNLWAMHNDPKYWKEPEKFRPERFIGEDGKTLQKTVPSFVPFSMGRRNCPGQTIAWMEILSYSTEILKRYKVTMAPGVKADFSVTPGLVTHLQPQLMCFTERVES